MKKRVLSVLLSMALILTPGDFAAEQTGVVESTFEENSGNKKTSSITTTEVANSNEESFSTEIETEEEETIIETEAITKTEEMEKIIETQETETIIETEETITEMEETEKIIETEETEIETTAENEINLEATEGDYAYTVSEDCATITGYTGSGGTIIVPVILGNATVTSIGDSAFKGSAVTDVILPNSITSIGNYSFSNCSLLNSLTLPNGLVKIGMSSFAWCTTLSTVQIPDTVTTIGKEAFSGCNNLKDVVLPKNLTTIESGVFTSPYITNITIPKSVTNMGYGYSYGYSTFTGCKNLETVVFEEGIEGIPDTALYCCESVKNIIIPEGVTYIGERAFRGTGIETLELPSTLETIGSNSIWACTSLKNITIPVGTKNIRSEAFLGCIALSTVQIPDTVTTIGKEAFLGCNKITIYGYENSYAEIYAKENNIPFEYITKQGIQSLTKSDVIKSDKYGIITYKNTKEGNVYNAAIAYEKAMNEYLEAVKKASKQDINKIDKGKEDVAAKLRKADQATNDRIITMPAGTPNDVMNSVYEALAQYLDMYVDKGVELGKIDLSKSSFEISTSLVKKIRNSIEQVNFERKIGRYTVRFDGIRMFDAYTGSVTVSGGSRRYVGSINSGAEKTARIMTQYLNEMSDVVKDLLKEALKSVFSELSSCTGIGELTNKKIKKILKNNVNLLQNNGYGDIMAYMLKVRDGYDLTKEIVSAKDANSLENALKKSKKIYDKLQKMDYSDAGVEKTIVDATMKKLDNAKDKLENALFDYIYNSEDGDKGDSLWDNIKKFFVQCPVDLEIYNSDGKVIGSVIDGIVVFDSNIYIEVNGDTKTIYIPNDMDVSIKYIGTGDGVMNYVVEGISGGQSIGRLNYYNIPLNEGIEYTQEITSGAVSDNTRSLPLLSDGKSINADEFLSADDNDAHINVSYNIEGKGTVIGDGMYPKGDPVELSAYLQSDEYEFAGWYKEDTLIELNSVYRFTAIDDVEVKAVFNRIKEKDENFSTILSPKYDEFAYVFIYKNENGTNDIVFSMFGMENISSLKVSVKKYAADGKVKEEQTYSTIYDESYHFILKNFDLTNCPKVNIYDEDKELIATICTEEGWDIPNIVIYTVTFNSNGGTVIVKQQVEENGKAVEPAISTMEGYIFTGWYLNGVLYDFNTEITSDITLEAGWKEVGKVATPFPNIASGSEVMSGTKLELSSDENAKIYYTIDGTEPSENKLLYSNPIIINTDITIKAIAIKEGFKNSDITTLVYTIEKERQYTVTFNSNGGSNISSQTVKENEKVTEPEIPIKEGYIFTGWYLNGVLYDFDMAVNFDIILEAGWTEYGKVETPTPSITSGSIIESGTKLRLTSDEGAKIYYTLDETIPTVSSNLFTEDILIIQHTVIKAFAVKEGFKDSDVATFIYDISTSDNPDNINDVLPEDIPENGIPNGLWIAGVSDVTYTGKAIKPSVRVYDYKTRLTEKCDYTISYKNNINANNATDEKKAPSVIIKAKGNYSGKDTATFKILAQNINSKGFDVVDIASAPNGKVQNPVPVLVLCQEKVQVKRGLFAESMESYFAIFRNHVFQII